SSPTHHRRCHRRRHAGRLSDGQITLTQAGFEPGKTVLASAIGGAVGNAVTQLARAQGAAKAISTTTNPAKAQRARALGFDNVIDLSAESLGDGVARITGGRGVDVVMPLLTSGRVRPVLE